jgi:hypothetical protein
MDVSSVVVQYILRNIEEFVVEPEDDGRNVKRVRGKQRSPSLTFFEHEWMRSISDKDVCKPESWQGKRFRRRFRVPFLLFESVLVPGLRSGMVFGERQGRIPIEMKILVALRILGRDNDNDTMAELSGISEDYCRVIFLQFLAGFKRIFMAEHVVFPKGAAMEKVNEVYRRMGLPGACGSMDCTHITWKMCPSTLTNSCKGKENYTTVAFLAIVDHNRRVLYCSGAYLGAASDKMIFNDDPFCVALHNGSLKDIEFVLVDDSSVPTKHRGGWLIVDGGFQKTPYLLDPQHYRMTEQEVNFNEWLESVRKDVECTFGILKTRFRFLRNGVRYHDIGVIESAMHCACTLHNMILTSDGHDTYSKWEDIDWGALDPDDEYWNEEDLDPANQLVPAISVPVVNLYTHFNATVAVGTDWTVKPPLHKTHVDLHRELLLLLVSNFNSQRRNGDVKWPANFSARSKSNFPEKFVARTSEELQPFKSCLYVKCSDLRALPLFTTIGQGLFAAVYIARDTVIGQFVGDIITYEAYEALAAGRKGYAVDMTEGRLLDCSAQAKGCKCKMSMANQAHGCYNISTRKMAVNNSSLLATSSSKGYFKLKATRNIPANVEILWPYGKFY